MADRAAPRGLPLLLSAVAVAGTAYLRVADPHDPAAPMPSCPTKVLTGLDCPGCGGLRLAHDLLHGDLRRAVHDNPFLLVVAPVLGGLAFRWARRRRRGEDGRVPERIGYALGGAAAAWMVVRNLPGWPLKPITNASTS